MDGANIRVLETGGNLSFAQETVLKGSVAGEMRGQKFNGDQSVEVDVFGFKHHSHTTPTNFFNQFVMGYDVVGHGSTKESGARIAGKLAPTGLRSGLNCLVVVVTLQEFFENTA